MSKIKTREKGKDIKLLDKSALMGKHMKNAFIRSKQSAEALMDDRQATPTEYAEEQVESAADNLIHDTANAAASGTKTAMHQGKKLFQRHLEKKAAEKRRENTGPNGPSPPPKPSQSTSPEGQSPQWHSAAASDRRLPRQRTDALVNGQHTTSATDRRISPQQTGTAPKRQRLTPIERVTERGQSPAHAHVKSNEDITSPVMERGRAFAQKQAAKWAEQKRQLKNQPAKSSGTVPLKPQNAAEAPRIAETMADSVIKSVGNPMTATRPAQVVDTAKTVDRTAKGTVKSAKRTVKTAQHTAKDAVKTSKTAIKTADHTAKAAQKTAQASAKAAKVTAQTARATAKAAAAAAKATAKGISATVKAAIASAKALMAAIAAGGWVAILAIVLICMIGMIAGSCFGIFFSGEDSGTGQTMPTVIREINQDYETKLEEIKNGNAHDKLEISGSRAVWPEVLAIYAVKTTTDPDNPLEVATMDDDKKQLLKELFWAMNEISYRTETKTTTKTVENDDGAGNMIEEEVEVMETILYIIVANKTADEMADEYGFTSDQRKQLAELLDDANRWIWSEVLYGVGTGDGEIVTVALSQIGNVGGQPYWSWYGFGSHVNWCACFVSWCANECGYIDAGVIPKFASCGIGAQWFKDRNLWQDNSYEPRPGDIIFFDWSDKGGQDGWPDHVGIVEKVEGGIIYTVEGNSSNKCRERTYPVGYYEIYGYGTPAF